MYFFLVSWTLSNLKRNDMPYALVLGCFQYLTCALCKPMMIPGFYDPTISLFMIRRWVISQGLTNRYAY